MTYDLLLRPRSGELDEQALVDYFNDRDGWSFPDDDDPDFIAYDNRITGVYFSIRTDLEESLLVFSLDFVRPSPFVLEADMELSALVDAFDLAIEDTQENGIEGATYNDRQFFRGWSRGNRWAYRTMLADVEADVLTYDGDALEAIWRWNYNLGFTAEENGGHYIAPPIGFVEHDGVVHTIFVYEVGQNMLVPRTDIVCLTRGDTDVLVPWSALAEALELGDGDKVDEPVDYWATLATTSEPAVASLVTQPSLEVRRLRLDEVHAIDDVDQDAHDDPYADAADDAS